MEDKRKCRKGNKKGVKERVRDKRE
jgi:hypothetical protein